MRQTDPVPGEGTREPSRDAVVAAAVRNAFGEICPDGLAGRILAAVREENRGLRDWPCAWLFAVPAVQILALVLLRCDLVSLAGAVADLGQALSSAAVSTCEVCAEWVRSGPQKAAGLLAASRPPSLELAVWVGAALLAAALSGAAVLGMERHHE